MWANVNTGNPKRSIFEPLLFLIYKNDLLNGPRSNLKVFADDTSLFSTVQDITTSTVSLNHDISEVSEWQYHSVMGNKFKSRSPRHFRCWGAFVPTQEKKKSRSLETSSRVNIWPKSEFEAISIIVFQ